MVGTVAGYLSAHHLTNHQSFFMGTTHLKKFLSLLILSAQKLITLDQDGNKKISLAETFDTVYSIVPKLPGVYDDLPEIKEEIKDLTREEVNELVDWFIKEFDLPGTERDKIEAIIEKSVSLAAHIYNYARDMRSLLA